MSELYINSDLEEIGFNLLISLNSINIKTIMQININIMVIMPPNVLR